MAFIVHMMIIVQECWVMSLNKTRAETRKVLKVKPSGFYSAWLPTGILLAYAAGFFALAVWRFRKSEL